MADPAPPTLGELTHAWRVAHGWRTDDAGVMVKITEEVGELARALGGEWEQRDGRGDVEQEAAQVVILVAALLHSRGSDVLAHVAAELARCGVEWAVPAVVVPAVYVGPADERCVEGWTDETGDADQCTNYLPPGTGGSYARARAYGWARVYCSKALPDGWRCPEHRKQRHQS